MIKIFHNKTLRQIIAEERFRFSDVIGMNVIEAIRSSIFGFNYSGRECSSQRLKADKVNPYAVFGSIQIVPPSNFIKGEFININPKVQGSEYWGAEQYHGFLGKNGSFILRLYQDCYHTNMLERYIFNVSYYMSEGPTQIKLNDPLMQAIHKKTLMDISRIVLGRKVMNEPQGVVIPETQEIAEFAKVIFEEKLRNDKFEN